MTILHNSVARGDGGDYENESWFEPGRPDGDVRVQITPLAAEWVDTRSLILSPWNRDGRNDDLFRIVRFDTRLPDLRVDIVQDRTVSLDPVKSFPLSPATSPYGFTWNGSVLTDLGGLAFPDIGVDRVANSGVYRLILRSSAELARKNETPSPHQIAVEVDNFRPRVSLLAPLDHQLFKGETVEISLTAADRNYLDTQADPKTWRNANFVQWRLSYDALSDTDDYIPIRTSSLPAADSVTLIWDISQLPAGTYRLKLEAEDAAGNVSSIFRTIRVVRTPDYAILPDDFRIIPEQIPPRYATGTVLTFEITVTNIGNPAAATELTVSGYASFAGAAIMEQFVETIPPLGEGARHTVRFSRKFETPYAEEYVVLRATADPGIKIGDTNRSNNVSSRIFMLVGSSGAVDTPAVPDTCGYLLVKESSFLAAGRDMTADPHPLFSAGPIPITVTGHAAFKGFPEEIQGVPQGQVTISVVHNDGNGERIVKQYGANMFPVFSGVLRSRPGDGYFSYDFQFEPDVPGLFCIKVDVTDESSTVCGKYESSAPCVVYRPPPPCPDLIVSSIRFYDPKSGKQVLSGTPAACNPVDVEATIVNVGNADATQTQTAFEGDLLPQTLVQTPAIPAGGVATVRTPWQAKVTNPNPYNVWVTADASGAIQECSVNNNSKQDAIRCRPPVDIIDLVPSFQVNDCIGCK